MLNEVNANLLFIFLQKEYSGRFSLWYDSLGGDAIGLTWDRSALKVTNPSVSFVLTVRMLDHKILTRFRMVFPEARPG